MKNIKILTLTILLALGSFANAESKNAGTHNWQAAKNLVLEAGNYAHQNGVNTLLNRINNGEFTTENSYIFMLDSRGFMLAHPYRKDLIGTNRALKQNYILRMISIVSQYGDGWIDYAFTDPKTGKTTPKLSYIKRISQNAFIGAGVY